MRCSQTGTFRNYFQEREQNERKNDQNHETTAAAMTQSCYIPSLNQTKEVTTGIGKPVLFGGDQLTVARARGAQKAKIHSVSPLSRLDGFVPMIEDWHAKVILLKVHVH